MSKTLLTHSHKSCDSQPLFSCKRKTLVLLLCHCIHTCCCIQDSCCSSTLWWSFSISSLKDKLEYWNTATFILRVNDFSCLCRWSQTLASAWAALCEGCRVYVGTTPAAIWTIYAAHKQCGAAWGTSSFPLIPSLPLVPVEMIRGKQTFYLSVSLASHAVDSVSVLQRGMRDSSSVGSGGSCGLRMKHGDWEVWNKGNNVKGCETDVDTDHQYMKKEMNISD